MSASRPSLELIAARHYPVTASLMTQETIFKPLSGTSYRWIEDGMPEIATRGLVFLNWISFCLVHRSVGQTIAASLITNASAKNATFLLATNEPLAQELLDYSAAFFAALNNTFSRQVERMACGEEAFEDADVRAMMDVVVARASSRILRKLEQLTSCGSWGDGGDVKSNLDRVFSLWEIHLDSCAPETARCTHQSVFDDYESILECSRLPQLQGQARSNAFHAAQLSAKRLIHSPFIKQCCDLAAAGSLHPRDQIFILKFHRRLWRFRFYSFGAERVLRGSNSDRMRQLCQSGWTLQHVWLPTRGELKVTIPVDRYSYITSTLARRGYRATPEILDKWLAPYKERDVWEAGVAQICRVHPEMQLMQHLVHDDAYRRNESVGTSKRPCLMCHFCIEHGYKAVKTPFKLTEASRKIATDWLSPILVGTGGPVDLGMKRYMSGLENNVVKRFRVTRGETELDRSPNYDFAPSA